MYVLTFTLGLCCSICFFLSPPVCFPQFCMVLPSFLHSLPRFQWSGKRCVCHLSVPPICKMCAPVLCGKLHVCVDLHFWLALLHLPLFFLGPWSPPVCFLQFCTILPSFLHSLSRLNGLERGVCAILACPHLQDVCTCLVLDSSIYVLTFVFGLCRFIFHCFVLCPPVCSAFIFA